MVRLRVELCCALADLSAASFLLRNGFNMEKPFTEGVHYLSRQEEEQLRTKLIQHEQVRSNLPDMEPHDDDSSLIDHIKQSVKNWQALPKDDQESFLNIPSEDAKAPIPSTLTRYQVRLTHQTVRNEYPNLKTQGMGSFVQITNPTSEQQTNQKDIRAQERELKIANAIGFRWVLESIMGGDISKLPHYYVVAGHPPEQAPEDVQGFLDELQKKLRSQSRIVVGHNCMTDVLNLYRCFIGDLPENVEDFSAKLHELFPMIMDTKYVAHLGNKRWTDTSLKAVESDLCSVGLPQIHLPTDFDRYLFAANYHEAGFDSFVTAKIGLKMPGKLKREHQDIKPLVDKSAPVLEQKSVAKQEESNFDAALGSHADKTDQKQAMAKSIGDMIYGPVSTVKSVLNGATSTATQEVSSTSVVKKSSPLIPASVLPTNGTVIATKEKSLSAQTSKNELQKLSTISKKRNIYDMLQDEPEDAPEDEPPITEEQRIAELVKEGKLMPRWEEDADFWKLISNKLQANATQEGILDLEKH